MYSAMGENMLCIYERVRVPSPAPKKKRKMERRKEGRDGGREG
jgi:hypothetical protein